MVRALMLLGYSLAAIALSPIEGNSGQLLLTPEKSTVAAAHEAETAQQHAFMFDLSQIPVEAKVTSARLKLCIAEAEWSQAPVTISVQAVSEDWQHAGDSVSGELALTDTLFASTLADLNQPFTADFNVTQSVQAWLSQEHENYGLVVRLSDDVGGTLSFQSTPGGPPVCLRVSYLKPSSPE